MAAWVKSSDHRFIGNCGLTEHSPAMKWFLNVRMARSAALRLCTCGGTNCRLTLFFLMARSRLSEVSLSITWNRGVWPLVLR